MTTAAGNPRILLRRLREIMAERTPAQARLDRVATLIANNMVAEVCSIYLARAGGELELFATEGLNKAAVHKTRLKRGEGLVGDIALNARPLNLSDAPSHPQFSYRPETGEDPFHSLMGVPILRDGRSLGVVVVQNKTRRLYEEEEIEALQTIAMVVAEMIASGDLIPLAELEETGIRRDRPWRAQGTAFAEGLAIGNAVLHEPRVKVERLIAEDVEEERRRVDVAIEELRASVDALIDAHDPTHPGESRDVLESYRMFAQDAGWVNRLREAVNTGLTAEAAVERVQSETRARMMRQTDPYLRERLHDLDDLGNRLLRHLAGLADTASRLTLPDNAVLIARNMGPAELLDYDRTRLKAVLLEEGSPTSHVSIVARALGIPLVGRIEGLVDQADTGNWAIVDGETGEVHLRPTSDIQNAYRAKLALRAQRQAEFAALRDKPAVTRDGTQVQLLMNAGLSADLPMLDETGAEGIGLFRTELPFMVSPRLPTLAEQTQLYADVLAAAGSRPVVFRTLDLGGDKVLPYAKPDPEENPALGWRAIRMALDRPVLLRYQVRAMLAGAKGRPLRIMFPMVAHVAEFRAARALVEREVRRMERHGHAGPSSFTIGTMLEVPSLAFSLPALLREADFLSVGTNDLMQFFFAADRGNPRLGGRYDALAPAMLRLISTCVTAAREAGKPLSVCGEMAARPLEAMALVGLGVETLSMSPQAVGPVKMMVRALDRSKLANVINGLIDSPEASLRPQLKEFAATANIPV